MPVPVLRGGLLGWLLLTTWLAVGQSPHLRRQRQQLARQPAGSPARAQALWHLAWESELPAVRQDSLAAVAHALSQQLDDPLDSLTARVWKARSLVYAGQFAPAQAQLLAALPVSRRFPDTWLRLQVLLLLARNHWGTATHARAETYLQQAWALAQPRPDPALRGRIAWLLGTYYVDSGKALAWFFRSLPLAEQAGDQALQVSVLSSIAYHYQQLKDLGQAQAYSAQALRLARQLNSPPTLCRVLVMSSGLYVARGQLAQARRQYREASRCATLRNEKFTIAADLAAVYVQAGMPDSALPCARQASQLAQSLYDRHVSYGTLAGLYLETRQLDSARSYGLRAYAHRPADTLHPVVRDLCATLAETYARQGDWRLAYAFQRRFQAYQDALSSTQVRAGVEQAQLRYELGHRQQLRQRDQELARLRRQRGLALAAGAGLLLLAAAVAGAVALRRRQAQRLGALRTRLAADLHDEVGTLLTRVSVQAELLGSLPPEQQPPAVARLLRNSRAAASTMRDVVWGIDARADSVGSLFDRMREYLHQTAAAAGWHTELDVRDWPDATPLPPALRQGVYRIFKEAVTNAVRHARAATTLRVRVSRHQQHLRLRLEDDGQPAPAPAVAPTGMGLRNMQQRAAELGGTLRAGYQPGGGYRVELEVPVREG